MVAAWKKSLVETESSGPALPQPAKSSGRADGRIARMECSARAEAARRADGRTPRRRRVELRQENQPFKTAPNVPAVYRVSPRDHEEVIATVEREMPDLPGRLSSFGWGVTREEAKRALADCSSTGCGLRRPSGRDVDGRAVPVPLAVPSAPAAPMEMVEPAVRALGGGQGPDQRGRGFSARSSAARSSAACTGWRARRTRRARSISTETARFTGRPDRDAACARAWAGVGTGTDHIQRLMVTGNFALDRGGAPEGGQRLVPWDVVDAVDCDA